MDDSIKYIVHIFVFIFFFVENTQTIANQLFQNDREKNRVIICACRCIKKRKLNKQFIYGKYPSQVFFAYFFSGFCFFTVDCCLLSNGNNNQLQLISVRHCRAFITAIFHRFIVSNLASIKLLYYFMVKEGSFAIQILHPAIENAYTLK